MREAVRTYHDLVMPRNLWRLALVRSASHNRRVRLSMLRRLASLFFVLAFIASAQAHAMPVMGQAKVLGSVAGMMQGTAPDSCKGCGQDGAPMKVDCTAMCAAVFAIIPPFPAEQSVDREVANAWTNETMPTHAIAPDTSPPRI